MNSHEHPDPPDRPPPLVYRITMAIMAPLEWMVVFNCRNFVRLASERCDRPLGTGEKLMFHAHRWMCGVCRCQEKRLQRLRALVKFSVQTSTDDRAVRLDGEARARLRKRLAQEVAGERENPGGSA